MNWKQTIGLFLNADGGVACNVFFAFLIVISCSNRAKLSSKLYVQWGDSTSILDAFVLAKVTNHNLKSKFSYDFVVFMGYFVCLCCFYAVFSLVLYSCYACRWAAMAVCLCMGSTVF
jgi:lipoprotein